jgi:serine/threonine protein kinase
VTEVGSPAPVEPGDLVADKYRVERVIGQGGMGVVVLAMHEHLEQRVALKFLLPAVAVHMEVMQRFVREARAVGKIQSEHVARVFDVGTHEGLPYMVMEYLEGEDIAQHLERGGPMPVEEAVGYLLQACEAIAEAHAVGIVHRDLKPANLFLARRPTGRAVVKVLDFGISKAPPSARDSNITRTAALLGSPSYMSPEQLVAARTVDGRSDIWALGIVLYEMLAVTLPFRAETMPQLVAVILNNPPEPLAALRADVPPGIQEIIDRCLQKDPSRRYASVAELARALALFGPPRSEISVDRIEHVLGVADRGSASAARVEALAAAGELPQAASSAAGSTLAATSSTPATRGRLLRWSPMVVLAAAGFGVLVAVALGHRARVATPIDPAPSDSVAGAAIRLAESAPERSPVAPSAAEPSAPATGGAPDPQGAASATVPLSASSHRRSPDAAPRVPSSASAAPSPSTLPSARAPCRTVSYRDADGDKHFKQECP